MTKISQPWSKRQQCQLAYVSEFTVDIIHLQGKANFVNDTSRATINVKLGINYAYMAIAQQQDAGVQGDHTANMILQLEDVHFGVQGAMLLCDVSTSHERSIVPASWRR